MEVNGDDGGHSGRRRERLGGHRVWRPGRSRDRGDGAGAGGFGKDKGGIRDRG